MYDSFKQRVGTNQYNLPVTSCTIKEVAPDRHEAYININNGCIIVGVYDPYYFPEMPLIEFFYDKPGSAGGIKIMTNDTLYVWNSVVMSSSGKRKLQFSISRQDLMDIIDYKLFTEKQKKLS